MPKDCSGQVNVGVGNHTYKLAAQLVAQVTHLLTPICRCFGIGSIVNWLG